MQRLTMLFRVALNCSAVLILTSAVVHPLRAQTSSKVQAFNQFIELKLSGDARFTASKNDFAAAWDQLDAAALEELNRSGSSDGLMKVFASLDGYRDPATAGHPFWGRLPDTKGSYAVVPLPGKPRRIVVTYELLFSLPGRFSVFEEKNGRWLQMAHIDTDQPVEAFPIERNGAGSLLLMVEKFVGADHEDGRFSLWKVNASGLSRYRNVGEFMDWNLIFENGNALLSYSELTRNLDAAVVGPRIRYEARIVSKSGGATVSQICVTPWLKTVDQYYSDLSGGRIQQALKLLRDPSIQNVLPGSTQNLGELEMESGDMKVGTGVVGFRAGAGIRRVQVNRERDGEWRIESIALEKK